MFESAIDTRHRDAFRRAHLARGAMIAEFWNGLFARRASRSDTE